MWYFPREPPDSYSFVLVLIKTLVLRLFPIPEYVKHFSTPVPIMSVVFCFFQSVGTDAHSFYTPIVKIPVLLCKFSISCWNDSLLLLGFEALCMPTKDFLKSLYRIVSPPLFSWFMVFHMFFRTSSLVRMGNLSILPENVSACSRTYTAARKQSYTQGPHDVSKRRWELTSVEARVRPCLIHPNTLQMLL